MEIKNSLRQVEGKRGHVVQIHVCRKRVSQSLYFIIVFLPFLSPSASAWSPFGKSGQLSNSSRTPSPSLKTITKRNKSLNIVSLCLLGLVAAEEEF